ncbi:MAG: hypothetical protein U0900_03490 [Myxococcota bacterium]
MGPDVTPAPLPLPFAGSRCPDRPGHRLATDAPSADASEGR